MELMQLEMFVAVVEERSFLLAAERVFRTQPAVSIGLRKLEEEIGVPLLDRSRRKSGRLTPRGEKLYEYASRILRLRNEMCSAPKEQESGSTGILRVGVTWEVNLDWIQPVTRQFNGRYPNLRVEVLCDQAHTLMRDLHEQRADVAVLSGRPKGIPGGGRLIVSRLTRLNSKRSFWIARPMQGQSLLASAFEKELQGQSGNMRSSGPSAVPSVRSPVDIQRTSPRPEAVPVRHHQSSPHVPVLKLRRS